MESARVTTTGMGGFLNPPTHPEHTLHVETGLARRPENRGGMSLAEAVECEWMIPPTVRKEAAQILAAWEPQPLETRDVQLWIRRALAYFANRWFNPEFEGGSAWNAENMIIDRQDGPPELAAGVHWIRKWYPDFEADETSTYAIQARHSATCGACGHHINAHSNGTGGQCATIIQQEPRELCACALFQA